MERTKIHPNRNFRNFLVNGKRPMLVSSPNPPGIELYYHANVFFCFRCKNKVTAHVNENTTNAKQLKQYSFSSSHNFESHLLHEICFKEKKSIVYGIVYRQHNSPEQFLNNFDDTIENPLPLEKRCALYEQVHIAGAHDFLATLLINCYLIPTTGKPTRVHKNSASLTDMSVNNPEQVASIIVNREDWFGSSANIRGANKDAKI